MIEITNPFLSRTLATISDVSLDEIVYLFDKTRDLKEAIASGKKDIIETFKINDPQFGIYEVFLEDSTRTKESFQNAAKFHNVKFNIFDSNHSSINKMESYADTFNNLIGYDNFIFIVRSKLEGVCRWLDISGKKYALRHNFPALPAFINAGDGKHEHPTQELLDEFTFLEDNDWDRSNIHIALVGDLFHGRTVHSKVDGLRIFREVRVDMIAPPEISMPQHYIQRMKTNGFEVRVFDSIAEYLAQDNIASKWYFTRPQLERMGEKILNRQKELRGKITFTEEYMDKIPDGTGFYHPLPRHKEHPTIPTFIDTTVLNRYERQSRNGYYTRNILLSAVAGKIGADFSGQPFQQPEYIDDFVISINPGPKKKEEPQEGIRPIHEGIFIDHICKGEPPEKIWKHLPLIIRIVGFYDVGYAGVGMSHTNYNVYKGLIAVPRHKGLDQTQIKQLAAVAPGCTLNIIKGDKVVEKYRLNMPPRIYQFDEISCRNPNCISSEQLFEGVLKEFYRDGERTFMCKYCDTPHSFKEIWKTE